MLPPSFTLGEIEDAVLAMGFKKTEERGRWIRFTHPASPVITLIPWYERSAKLLPIHCRRFREDLVDFGFIANPEQFEEVIRNRGRVAS